MKSKQDIDLKEVQKSPMYGMGKGFEFNELEKYFNYGKIKAVQVRAGDLIDAVKFEYERGDGDHHGGHGGKLYRFELKSDEYITKVSGRCGMVIDSIKFETSLGNVYSYGGKGGGESFSYSLGPEYCLVSINGFNPVTNHLGPTTVARLGFSFSKINVLKTFDAVESTLKDFEGLVDEKDLNKVKTVSDSIKFETTQMLTPAYPKGNGQDINDKEIVKALVEKVQLLEAQSEFKDALIMQMMERLEKLESKQVEKEQKLYCVTEVVYENELLNHPELLKLSIKEFGISRVLDMSNSLSSELISEAIEQNNSELLLAGCISLDCSDII